MDDQEFRGLELVSTLFRYENGRCEEQIGDVYITPAGLRIVKWRAGIDPETIQIIEKPASKGE